MDNLDRVDVVGAGISRRANKIKTFRVYPLGECMLEALSVVQTPDETLVWPSSRGRSLGPRGVVSPPSK